MTVKVTPLVVVAVVVVVVSQVTAVRSEEFGAKIKPETAKDDHTQTNLQQWRGDSGLSLKETRKKSEEKEEKHGQEAEIVIKKLERTKSRPWLGRRRPGAVRGLRRRQHGQSRPRFTSQGRPVTESNVPTTPSRESADLNTGTQKPISGDGSKHGDQTEVDQHTWVKTIDLTKHSNHTQPPTLSLHPTLTPFTNQRSKRPQRPSPSTSHLQEPVLKIEGLFDKVSFPPESSSTPRSTLPPKNVLTAPFSTSRAAVRDITTAAPPDTPPTPTRPREKVAKNTEIRIDTSVFQITTVTPPSTHKLRKSEGKHRITGFAGLTFPPEDTDEGKGKLYKPFTLPSAPSSESWRVNKGTKGKSRHVAELGSGKQGVRENEAKRSDERETEAERDTPHYWEYLHDRKGSGRVHESQSISKELEKELPHRILASTQDIIEKSSVEGKRETKVKEEPSARQALLEEEDEEVEVEEKEADLRPGSSFSYVSFRRFPTKPQSSPGLDNESEGREDTTTPNPPSIQQRDTPDLSRTTKSIQDTENPFRTPFPVTRTTQSFSRTRRPQTTHDSPRPTTFAFRTTPTPSRTTRTQIKVPRPSSRPKAISSIRFFQGGLESVEEDSDKQEEHSKGTPVLPLESLLEVLEEEEDLRGKEGKDDVFFPSFDNFLREHGISDILKTRTHKDEGNRNSEVPRSVSLGTPADLKQPQGPTDQVRDQEQLERRSQHTRFSATHRQRFQSPASHNAPTSQPLVLPFPANQRPPHSFPSNQKSPTEVSAKPPREFSANKQPGREFSANKQPGREFSANKQPGREFSANLPREFSADQRPPRDFVPNKKPPREFSANQRPPREFSTNKEPVRDFSANQHRGSFRAVQGARQNHHVASSIPPANHGPKFHPSPKPSDVIGGRDLLPFLKEFPASTTPTPLPLPHVTSLPPPPLPPPPPPPPPSRPRPVPPPRDFSSVGSFFPPTPRFPLIHTSPVPPPRHPPPPPRPPPPPSPPKHQGKDRPSGTSSFSIGSPSGSFKSHPASRPGPRGPNESLTLPGPPKDIKFKDFGESSGPFLKSGPLKLPPPQGPARPLPAPEGHLPVLPQGHNAVDSPQSFPGPQDRPYSLVKLEPQVILNIPQQGRFEGLPPQDPFRPPSRPRGKRPQGSRGPPPGAKPAHHARAPGRNPRIQFSASPEAVVKSPTGGIRSTRDSPHHLHSPGDFHPPQFTQPAPPRPQGKRNPLGNPHGNAVPGIRIPEFSPPHGATGDGHNFSPFPQGRDTPRRPPRRPREHSGDHFSHPQPDLFPPPQSNHNHLHHPLPQPQPHHHNHHHSPQPHQNAHKPPQPHIRGTTFSHTPKPEPQPFPSHLQKGLDASEASQPLPGELRVKMSESHARLLRNMEYGVHGEPLDVWIPIAN